jgi:hypothetical protein
MAPKRALRLELDFVALVRLILRDYHGLLTGDPATQDDAAIKAVASRHTACRTVLSHLEQLLKTAAEHADETQLKEIDDSLAKFRAEMALHIKEEPTPDEDGDGG